MYRFSGLARNGGKTVSGLIVKNCLYRVRNGLTAMSVIGVRNGLFVSVDAFAALKTIEKNANCSPSAGEQVDPQEINIKEEPHSPVGSQE